MALPLSVRFSSLRRFAWRRWRCVTVRSLRCIMKDSYALRPNAAESKDPKVASSSDPRSLGGSSARSWRFVRAWSVAVNGRRTHVDPSGP